MVIAINSTFMAEKNKRQNQPVFLYSLFDYDQLGSNLHYAEYDADVQYKGVNYLAFPITHDTIGENSSNEIDAVRVRISNVSRLLQAYLEKYDIRGKKLVIKMVWANQLSDPDAYIDHVYYVESYSATQDSVELTLTSKFDVLDVSLPARKYSRNHCAWKFKGSECGYTGGESACNRTLQRCRELNNVLRFGGHPSIPSRKVFTI